MEAKEESKNKTKSLYKRGFKDGANYVSTLFFNYLKKNHGDKEIEKYIEYAKELESNNSK